MVFAMLDAASKEVRLSYARKSSHPRVGVLMAGDRTYPAFQALCDVLRQPGRTIEIAARFAEGRHERLPQLALEIAALRPDVILAVGAVSFYAIRAIAPSAPVVFAVVVDPEAAGIGSGAWPGASVTGATSFDADQPRQQIRRLKQVVPGLEYLAILGDSDVPPLLAELTQAAALAEGIRPVLRLLGGADEIMLAIAGLRDAGAQALLALEVPRTSTFGREIVEAAIDAGLPTLLGRDMARANPLVACGTSFAAAARLAAAQVNLLLTGMDLSRLPIEHIAELETIINLDTARRFGHHVPAEALEAATEVVNTVGLS